MSERLIVMVDGFPYHLLPDDPDFETLSKLPRYEDPTEAQPSLEEVQDEARWRINTAFDGMAKTAKEATEFNFPEDQAYRIEKGAEDVVAGRMDSERARFFAAMAESMEEDAQSYAQWALVKLRTLNKMNAVLLGLKSKLLQEVSDATDAEELAEITVPPFSQIMADVLAVEEETE